MARQNLYELVVIFDSQGDEMDIKREFDIVQSLIERRSVEFLGRVDWGLKNFAYPIRKRKSGYYVYYLFKANVEIPAQLSMALKMDEKVLRHLIIRAKSSAKTYLQSAKAEPVKDKFEPAPDSKMDHAEDLEKYGETEENYETENSEDFQETQP